MRLVPPSEMVDLAQERADYHEQMAVHFARDYRVPAIHEEHRRKFEAFQRMAHMLRIIATYEATCRTFFAGLLKEHRG